MLKPILWTLTVVIVVVVVLYIVAWSVPIDPVAWNAPPNSGYSGPFEQNERLRGIQVVSIGANHGPEDIAIDAQGRIYASTHEGRIVRLQADGSNPENWLDTGGRPVGIAFDDKGN